MTLTMPIMKTYRPHCFHHSRRLTCSQLQQAIQAHQREYHALPVLVRVNQTLVSDVTVWLAGLGMSNIEVQGNGGTFDNEVETAAANGAIL